MEPIHFLDDDGTFTLNDPEAVSCLYFPLASEAGLKSAITPGLGGDCKLDQETFLLEPVSSENLHTSRNTRNFWCVTEKGCWSAAGASAQQEADRFTEQQDESALTAGLMWQTVERESKRLGLKAEITSFVPPQDNVEIMEVQLTNTGTVPRNVTGIAAVPIYGRSADNLRDHRNVTSMLHRIKTTDHGVLVKPTMSFDEKGHRENRKIYYVLGSAGTGEKPAAFYPTVEGFLGEGGTFLKPRAVYEGAEGLPAGTKVNGREAMGGIRFPAVTLEPGQSTEYIVLLGVSEDEAEIDRVLSSFHTVEQVRAALSVTRAHWQEQVNVRYHTGNPDFDRWMRWVSFQPFLRRLYGCSFLPHHDYGRGGRGWRDLWQDCLSLLLMDPQNVGDMIRKNFGGVRVDGTNATIIGAGDGNFIADRNGIARVWMDHALWPLMTTKLYIDQTGDLNILNSPAPYFKDPQALRGTGIDQDWNDAYGNRQRTESGEVYQGTILEHLLIQQLTAFYEVGDHNTYRLRDADWNDALDMASENGESVAFTCAYAGNLLELAALIRLLDSCCASHTAELLEEITILLDSSPEALEDIERKRQILSDYTSRCRHTVSGKSVRLSLSSLAVNLIRKANWLMEHLRSQEWIEGTDGEGWFNSYYDNSGRAVEGFFDGQVRMMLTGQVFAIMSGVAQESQIEKITRSADRYLYRKEIGGYRLNTDFQELKFDMGRMFGFAYGEKENGAVFSHMTVMYANALYRRGFAKEGWKALKTLADTALDFNTSRIYPGIPEYFSSNGRGMYHYLTGAASWFMLTMVTEVFGMRGDAGDLILHPKLLACQFDAQGAASISSRFAGKDFTVTYRNENGKDFGSYIIGSAFCDGRELAVNEDSFVVLSREMLQSLSDDVHQITVHLV